MPADHLSIKMKLEGRTAAKNRLLGFDAGESIAGFSRSIELITYFLASGTVRHRRPELDAFHLDLVATA